MMGISAAGRVLITLTAQNSDAAGAVGLSRVMVSRREEVGP
jgi:hypothetical protein